MLIKILILLLLGSVVIQDFNRRSVYWFIFPLLLTGFCMQRYFSGIPAMDILINGLINLLFLTAQFLIMTIYFSLKKKRLVRLTSNGIGWGDILFIFATAFYLNTMTFFLYYVSSLVFSLVSWVLRQWFKGGNERLIPLAGLQAMFLALMLIIDWWIFSFGMNIDNLLL